jgi:hypothetical protein
MTTPFHGASPDAQTLDDTARLQEIADLRLNDSDIDGILSDITAEAAAHFGLPVALLSVVLDQAQYFLGSHGLDGWMATTRGTPVEWSFCRHVVRNREPFVVDDGVRCYAGVPLITSSGHAVGSFCVQGPDARSFSEDDLAQLQRYAKRVITRIEQRRRG